MPLENRLFVAKKPPFIPSNFYLNRLKRRHGFKKGGFSGTLDPFAKGTLVIATGQYARLFRFFRKSKKTYLATLWLGVHSETLDIEGVDAVSQIPPMPIEKIEEALHAFKGVVEFVPPKYSAKKIQGARAYKLVRQNVDFELQKSTMEIFEIKLLNYSHPFIHFEVECSEGAYIRSLGELIANKLGYDGALCSLERIKEGDFLYNDENLLNPLEFLEFGENFASLSKEEIELGAKLQIDDLAKREEGYYYLDFDTFFSIIRINEGKVEYELNRILKC